MKKLLITLYLMCFFCNPGFADDEKETAQKCINNMLAAEEAVNEYIKDHNIKGKTHLFDQTPLFKEKYIDSKKKLECPSKNNPYTIMIDGDKCDIFCLNHGSTSLVKLAKQQKKLEESFANMTKRLDEEESNEYYAKRMAGLINIAIFLIIILVSIITFIFYFIRKRKVISFCAKNNFVYEESPISLTGNSEAFDVLIKGDTSHFLNGMYQKRGNISINIVDFIATTRIGMGRGRGRGSRNENFTLCQLHKEKVQFPVFFVRDENVILDSIGSALGGQDIDFFEDKRFSNKFVLQGVDESEVRRFFNSKVRNAFLNNHRSGYCYEGKGSCFLLYVKGHVSLKKKMEMLSNALKIFNIISTTGYVDNTSTIDIPRNPKYYG